MKASLVGYAQILSGNQKRRQPKFHHKIFRDSTHLSH